MAGCLGYSRRNELFNRAQDSVSPSEELSGALWCCRAPSKLGRSMGFFALRRFFQMSHIQHYSRPSFWNKLRGSAAGAGAGVVEKALCLYYAYGASTTPAWAKAAIAGALGYFILPLD